MNPWIILVVKDNVFWICTSTKNSFSLPSYGMPPVKTRQRKQKSPMGSPASAKRAQKSWGPAEVLSQNSEEVASQVPHCRALHIAVYSTIFKTIAITYITSVTPLTTHISLVYKTPSLALHLSQSVYFELYPSTIDAQNLLMKKMPQDYFVVAIPTNRKIYQDFITVWKVHWSPNKRTFIGKIGFIYKDMQTLTDSSIFLQDSGDNI